MAPVSPEGWKVVNTFVACMVGGAVAAVLLLVLGFTVVPWIWVLAPFVFVGAAFFGARYFVTQAQGRGDHNHTVEDYKAGRV